MLATGTARQHINLPLPGQYASRQGIQADRTAAARAGADGRGGQKFGVLVLLVRIVRKYTTVSISCLFFCVQAR
jgi:hypothetical protein